MAFLLIETCAFAAVSVLCGLTISRVQLADHSSDTDKNKPQLAYTITRNPKASLYRTQSVLNAEGQEMYHFKKGLGQVTSNLYRLHGQLQCVHSGKDSINLYRSMIGNSGYIEWTTEDSKENSHGFQLFSAPCSKNLGDRMAMRIFVSAKITNREFELETEHTRSKFRWASEEGKLYFINGTDETLAATVECKHFETKLYVCSSVLSPLIAVCLFFL